jgi:hypothetical protein
METRPLSDPRLPYGRERPHTETAAEARQGPLGRPILYVLIGGLILGGVYLIGTQIWSNSEDLPPAPAVEPALPAADPAPPAAIPPPAPTPVPTP